MQRIRKMLRSFWTDSIRPDVKRDKCLWKIVSE
jgi:hypothetical protein